MNGTQVSPVTHPMKFCFLFVLALICVMPSAQAGELKLEAQLVWATNDKASPDPNHKPVEASLVKKLQQLPVKWNNFFEVNRQKLSLPSKGSQRVTMSKECVIDVKDVGDSRVEVTLIGKGKVANKTTKPSPHVSFKFVLGPVHSSHVIRVSYKVHFQNEMRSYFNF